MTTALCLTCGEMKLGAWTDCPNCGFKPATDREFTQHLLMSEHHQRVEALEAAGQRIKAGETLEFDEDALLQLWVSRADVDAGIKEAKTALVGCAARTVAVIAIVVFGIYLIL